MSLILLLETIFTFYSPLPSFGMYKSIVTFTSQTHTQTHTHSHTQSLSTQLAISIL